jgi:hypothetical protein
VFPNLAERYRHATPPCVSVPTVPVCSGCCGSILPRSNRPLPAPRDTPESAGRSRRCSQQPLRTALRATDSPDCRVLIVF